jgi:hypothetical protein
VPLRSGKPQSVEQIAASRQGWNFHVTRLCMRCRRNGFVVNSLQGLSGDFSLTLQAPPEVALPDGACATPGRLFPDLKREAAADRQT